MQTMYDLRQVLKRFGTFIYTGNKLADLELMEEEIRELYRWKMIEQTEYQQSLLLIKRERRKLTENKQNG